MIEATHYTAAGSRRDAMFALPADYFDGTVNEAVMHQAVKVYLNNQRQGTHATKTRAEVSGGNQKPWKQKGTGRARQGSTRAPHWRGGGIVFGPQPRDYRTAIPKKVRQLARKSALNARARENALVVVERFAFEGPKTAELVRLLAKLGAGERKVLVLTRGTNEAVYLSGRNLPTVQVMSFADASAYDILWSDTVVVEEGALTGADVAETESADEESAPAGTRKARTPKAAGAKKAARAAKPAAKSAKRSTKKAAADKPAGRKPGKAKAAPRTKKETE